jgi:hypothetical protein
MQRFAMVFDRAPNQSFSQQANANFVQNLAAVPRRPTASLSSPMIERVHKSKPGCSACGKKVM